MRAVAVRARVMNPLELLLYVAPVFIERIGDSGPGRGDDVGPRQHVEFAAPGDVSDVDSIRPRRLEHVDVPVVHATVNRDVADVPLGRTDVVSSLETSITRRIGRASCQSCPRAARARERVVRLSSQ